MKVLISGGGIAGLTLALCLHRHGHEPVIVERSPKVRDEVPCRRTTAPISTVLAAFSSIIPPDHRARDRDYPSDAHARRRVGGRLGIRLGYGASPERLRGAHAWLGR